MKIIEINIIQFGKFKDRVFKLEDGFNVIKGENESGKSTLLAFIKFALYGVGRKNPSVAVGERERAISWNVGIAAGSLTVSDVDGKKYRIERNGRESAKGSYSDKVRIIDLENGEEVFENEIPGEHFLGIDAQAYDSMCNIKQLEAVAIGSDAVKGVIDNLLSSGDENMNIQSALKALDVERRRLLHTNGKGGLVYDSAMTLERLKSEYKGAVISENERIKNYGELENVEITLAKAKDEFDVAQKMCDLYDDVLRLEKFDTLREYNNEAEALLEKSRELDASAEFDLARANYDYAAKIRALAASLERSKSALDVATEEYNSCDAAYMKQCGADQKDFSEIIDEFGTPSAAITHLASKKKKRTDSALFLTLFSVVGAVLLIFAAALVFVLSNAAGAATVGFIALVLLILAGSFYKNFSRAKAEISSFMQKMGEGFCPKDESKILSALEGFYNGIGERARLSNAREGAKFRMGIANESHFAERSSVLETVRELDSSKSDRELCDYLLSLADQINEYLVKRGELDSKIRENQALIRALKSELERFSERDIRAKINPEMAKKIKDMPFERLKADRDAALYKTNQFNQYRASIERNISSVSNKRSASDIFPEIEEENDRLSALKLRLDAIRLATETINGASSALKSSITPRIRERAEENLATVTAGKYSELYIDDNMGLSIFADGATRPIDSLSKGSLDAAYFSVRLALLQTLLAEKEPPLYMDETLSQLDDNRARNAIKVLDKYSKHAQCVLFTCQARDVELAKEISSINLIEL